MEEGPVADQMHDNETEISDFALTLRLFTVVRFSRVRATKGPYGGKKNSGAKKKKGENILQNVVLRYQESRQRGRDWDFQLR